MQYKLVSDTGERRLIIFFAGWGMDWRPFATLARRGYDVAVVWDYTSFQIDWSFTRRYEEIGIVAWSMGVFAAALTTAALDPRVTRRIALGGTLTPVSDEYGIPADIFQATLDTLDERRLAKFYRRMFVSRAEHEVFRGALPQRDLDSLRRELVSVREMQLSAPQLSARYDRAYIGTDDAIFPAVAQQRAWQVSGVPYTLVSEIGHWIDPADILRREFVDKSTMAVRFAAARDTYERAGIVQAEIVDALVGALRSVPGVNLSRARDILEVGCGSGLLSRPLRHMAPEARLTLWDIAAGPGPDVPGAEFRCCDAEIAVADLAPDSLDAIVSASTIQWFNSPGRFVARCARALRPGGIFAFTTFTEGNLHQISAITGSSLPLRDSAGWMALCRPHLRLLHVARWRRDMSFATPLDALRHLKATGVNSLGGSAHDIMRRLTPSPDGTYRLTYTPLVIIARKEVH